MQAACRGCVEMMRVNRLGEGLILALGTTCVCHHHCWSDGGVGVGHSLCGYQHIQ